MTDNDLQPEELAGLDNETKRALFEQYPSLREHTVTELLKKYAAETAKAREVYAETRESAVRRAMMELELLGVDLSDLVRQHLAKLCGTEFTGEPLRRTNVTYNDRELQIEVYP